MLKNRSDEKAQRCQDTEGKRDEEKRAVKNKTAQLQQEEELPHSSPLSLMQHRIANNAAFC